MYDYDKLGEYAKYFKIFEESINDILKGYADSMMQKLPIDQDTNRPDLEIVTKQAINIKMAADKAKIMLDYYYAAYLNIKEKEETIDEGVNKAGE